MASTPATNTAAPAASFKPFFQRISQGEDRHADVLACCAMLCNKSIADIFKQAETLGLPKVGPYYGYAVDGDFMARLLAAHGLVATVWKEAKSYPVVQTGVERAGHHNSGGTNEQEQFSLCHSLSHLCPPHPGLEALVMVLEFIVLP